jgi:hypothetical protein
MTWRKVKVASTVVMVRGQLEKDGQLKKLRLDRARCETTLTQLRQLPHSECKKTGSFAVFEAGNTDFFVE